MQAKAFYLVTTICLALVMSTSQAQIIHQERSLYRNIIVEQEGNIRCMRFTKKKVNGNSQSCMDLDNPDYLLLAYAKLVLGGLLLHPEPEKILIIGLGGGPLTMALHQILPNAQIDSVEIDPAVVKMAKQYFYYQESEKVSTTVADGRIFVKRQALKKNSYDMIILDAFTGDYIPEHLMTLEFLQEVKSLLTKDGLVIANTFSTSKLYHHESATYERAFPHLLNVRSVDTDNRILFAQNYPFIKQTEIQQNSDKMLFKLRKYGVDTPSLAKLLVPNKDWDSSKQVLTDQFAPANLLKQ